MNGKNTIQIGDLQRTYFLHAPAAYTAAKATSLVLAFHGGRGTGQGIIALTGFNDLADRQGFIVAYPDGVDKHWNDGRVAAPTADDVAFISALIDRLSQSFTVDPKRIYATGISNGAIFSYRLACDLSDKIAAIGTVAGSMDVNIAARCAPRQSVAIIQFHGTDDPLVPYNGGEVNGDLVGKVLSASESITRWAKLDDCTEPPQTENVPDAVPYDGMHVQRLTYRTCQNESGVSLYTINGGGHTWPGGLQYAPQLFIGKTSRAMNATDLIWKFFAQHPKP